MASTSQIAKSLHSGNRRSSRILALLFVAGFTLTVVPGAYFALKDSPQIRNAEHLITASVASLLSKYQKSNLASGTAGTLNPANPAFKPPSPSSDLTNLPAGGTSEVRIVDAAVASLSAQLEKDPGNPSIHNRLGIIYAELGELKEAQGQFNQAISLARQGLSSLYGQIELKKREGDVAAASNLMLTVSSMQLELSSAHSNLARVFEKLGQNNRVVAQLDELNKDVVIGGLAQGGQGEKAGLDTKKVSPDVVSGLAKAEALLQVGRLNDAATELKMVLSIDPSLAAAHLQLGKVAMASGNNFLAQRELEITTRLDPKAAEAYGALGMVYCARNKTAEAMRCFTQALSLNPKDAASAFNLGNIHAARNNNQAAIDLYRRALNIDPQMAAAHNNLASMLSAQGNYEGAVGEFEQALSLAPAMDSAHYGLGLAMMHMEDYVSAAKEFKRAIALNANLVDAQSKAELCMRRAGMAFNHQRTN